MAGGSDSWTIARTSFANEGYRQHFLNGKSRLSKGQSWQKVLFSATPPEKHWRENVSKDGW